MAKVHRQAGHEPCAYAVRGCQLMRGIKFRGKAIETGKWLEGDLIKIGPRYFIVEEAETSNEYGDGSDLYAISWSEVDPETLGQYTGLKDKNGVEIYKGDIVDFTYWWFDGNEAESHLTGEVVYLPEFMSYGLRGVKNAEWIRHIGGEEGSSDTAPFALWTFEEADFEVIGNIYQHPLLLEGVKA